MEATEFRNDAKYLAWLADHPVGFALNVDIGGPSKYAMLHKSTCYHISKTKHPPGAFAERQEFKVCSEVTNDLLAWGKRKGRGEPVPRCQHCDP